MIADIFSMGMTFFLPKEQKTPLEDEKVCRAQGIEKTIEVSEKDIKKNAVEENIDTDDKQLKKDNAKKNNIKKAALGADIKNIFRHKKAIVYVAMFSVFGIAWILITFFYVERLESCGISAEWMSLIVLIYSAVQMLAEPLIHRFRKISKAKMLMFASMLGGVLLIIFGMMKVTWLVLVLMLILPLALNLPEYYLMEQENQFVDEIGSAKNRATVLSILNMGVNVIEIFALFASAILSGIGIEWCFLFTGAAVIACVAVLYRSRA